MRYVYCIASEPKPNSLGNIGLHGTEVSKTTFKDLCVFSSDIPDPEKVNPGDAPTHENVIIRIMKDGSVVPLGFGFFAKDDDEIQVIMKQGYIPLKETIERLNGTIQASLKIRWNSKILARILEKSEVKMAFERLKADQKNNSLKIELGKTIKKYIAEEERVFISEIYTSLKHFYLAYKEKGIDNDYEILNTSFLLREDEAEKFLSRLDELQETHKNFKEFRCTIPLPPYDFVKMNVRKFDFGALSDAKKTMGLDDEFSLSDIEIIFNKRARLCHPDEKTRKNAEHDFIALKKARDLLIEYCENSKCRTDRPSVEEKLVFCLTDRQVSTR